MTVYVINNMTVHDQDEYKAYVKGFMPVFERFGGKLLAVQNGPRAIEGVWPFDRTVLLSFPTRSAYEQWSSSAAYKAIEVHRHAGTVSNVVVLDALPPVPSATPGFAQARSDAGTKNVVQCVSVQRGTDDTTLVLTCLLESGSVAAGMLLHISLNFTLSISMRILEVTRKPGSYLELALDCEEADGPDFIESLNLVGDHLEVTADPETGSEAQEAPPHK